MAKKKQPSYGVRKRLGRRVIDAEQAIHMYLTKVDVAEAIKKRVGYDVDDPENFTDCGLATCLSKTAGAEVMVLRRYVYVALPGEEYTLRFQMNRATERIVEANDVHELNEQMGNTLVSFLPPSPGRRLISQGGERVDKHSRGILKNPPRPSRGDPYKGVYRDGRHAPVNGKHATD